MKLVWLRPKNFRSFWKKNSAKLSKLLFTCPGDTLGENVFGSLLVCFFFLILGQKSWTFDETFSAVRQIFILRFHGNNSRKNCYSKKPKTYKFRGFVKSFSERLLKTAFHLFTAQLWTFDQFLTKILYLTILRTLGENLSDCGK